MEREERDVRVAWVSAQKGRFQEDAVQLYITFQKASELKNNSHLFILPPGPPVSSAHCLVHLGCHFSQPDSIWRFGLEPGGEDSSFPRNAFISIPRLYPPGRGGRARLSPSGHRHPRSQADTCVHMCVSRPEGS